MDDGISDMLSMEDSDMMGGILGGMGTMSPVVHAGVAAANQMPIQEIPAQPGAGVVNQGPPSVTSRGSRRSRNSRGSHSTASIQTPTRFMPLRRGDPANPVTLADGRQVVPPSVHAIRAFEHMANPALVDMDRVPQPKDSPPASIVQSIPSVHASPVGPVGPGAPDAMSGSMMSGSGGIFLGGGGSRANSRASSRQSGFDPAVLEAQLQGIHANTMGEPCPLQDMHQHMPAGRGMQWAITTLAITILAITSSSPLPI